MGNRVVKVKGRVPLCLVEVDGRALWKAVGFGAQLLEEPAVKLSEPQLISLVVLHAWGMRSLGHEVSYVWRDGAVWCVDDPDEPMIVKRPASRPSKRNGPDGVGNVSMLSSAVCDGR